MYKIKVVKSSIAPKDREVLWVNPLDKSINIFDDGWINMLATNDFKESSAESLDDNSAV